MNTTIDEEDWLCQQCGQIKTGESTWIEGTGNVCDTCMDGKDQEREPFQGNVLTHNGVFTVKSLKTGEHRTFSVRTQSKESQFAPGKRVVALLSGPDNNQDYVGFGFVEGNHIKVWHKKQTTFFVMAATMLERLDQHIALGHVEVFAATRCRVCNRRLTTPESVASGIGPICEGRQQ